MAYREVKTVNSWFQNKRASLKKRNRGRTSGTEQVDFVSSAPPTASTSSPSTPPQFDLEESPEDEHAASQLLLSSVQPSIGVLHPFQPSFYTGASQQRSLNDPESLARRNRLRPSSFQNEELRKLYNVNPHPSREEREELGARIGM